MGEEPQGDAVLPGRQLPPAGADRSAALAGDRGHADEQVHPGQRRLPAGGAEGVLRAELRPPEPPDAVIGVRLVGSR